MASANFEIYDESGNIILDLGKFPCSAIGTVTFPSTVFTVDRTAGTHKYPIFDQPVKLFSDISLDILTPYTNSCTNDSKWYVARPWFATIATVGEGFACVTQGIGYVDDNAPYSEIFRTPLYVENNVLYARAIALVPYFFAQSLYPHGTKLKTAETIMLIGVMS